MRKPAVGTVVVAAAISVLAGGQELALDQIERSPRLLTECVAEAQRFAESWRVTEEELKATPARMAEQSTRTKPDIEISAEALPRKMALFLLVGQSNMAGRGEVAEPTSAPIERCYKLGRNNTWLMANTPIHFDRDSAGYGLANRFVEKYLAEHPGETVGLIPCAVGGSNSATWSPEPGTGIVGANFRNAVYRGKIAAQSGKIVAILWHQGESDRDRCASIGGDYYVARLKAIAEAFRRQLSIPDAPFVIGEIGKLPKGHYSVMNPLIRKAADGIENCVCVPAEDLTGHLPDGAHFDTAAYKTLGERYYEAWKKLN